MARFIRPNYSDDNRTVAIQFIKRIGFIEDDNNIAEANLKNMEKELRVPRRFVRRKKKVSDDKTPRDEFGRKIILKEKFSLQRNTGIPQLALKWETPSRVIAENRRSIKSNYLVFVCSFVLSFAYFVC